MEGSRESEIPIKFGLAVLICQRFKEGGESGASKKQTVNQVSGESLSQPSLSVHFAVSDRLV